MTCYDLRFPELARALVDAGAEVLVVPAAWVAGPHKVDHWRTLVRARAIENTVFVVAVGQPGPRYTGHSLVVDPLGEVLAEAADGAEIVTAVLRAHGPGAGPQDQPVAGQPASVTFHPVSRSAAPVVAPNRRRVGRAGPAGRPLPRHRSRPRSTHRRCCSPTRLPTRADRPPSRPPHVSTRPRRRLRPDRAGGAEPGGRASPGRAGRW